MFGGKEKRRQRRRGVGGGVWGLGGGEMRALEVETQQTGKCCYASLPGINTSPWVPAHSDTPSVSGASGFLGAL